MLTNPILSPFASAQSSPVAVLVRGAAGVNSGGAGSGPIQDLVRLAQTSSRPAFELDFNIAQNQALARLDAKVAELQGQDFASGKTALLRIKAARLERELVDLEAYKAVVSSNRSKVTDALAQLTELRAFAASSTVAEFDAKKAEVLVTLDKLRTAQTFRFGAPDGLRSAKADGLADIDAIVTNNFATPADIQAAQDTIDTVSSSLTVSATILDGNQNGANSLISSARRGIADSKSNIDEIVAEARSERVADIEAERDRTAQILTNISLAFETNQAFNAYIAQATVLTPGTDPGSVLNLFG